MMYSKMEIRYITERDQAGFVLATRHVGFTWQAVTDNDIQAYEQYGNYVFSNTKADVFQKERPYHWEE